MEERQHGAGELLIEIVGVVPRWALIAIAQPVTPSIWASNHQPSRTLKFRTPFKAAFMPLVPEASSGGSRC
jgi:hypothetical protein